MVDTIDRWSCSWFSQFSSQMQGGCPTVECCFDFSLQCTSVFGRGWESLCLWAGYVFCEDIYCSCYWMLSFAAPHLFPLFPKIHAVQHTWLTLKNESATHGYGMNPLTASCQLDEDTIGRVSRVSRRVNVRLVVLRTLQRHLMSSWNIWMDAGVLR